MHTQGKSQNSPRSSPDASGKGNRHGGATDAPAQSQRAARGAMSRNRRRPFSRNALNLWTHLRRLVPAGSRSVTVSLSELAERLQMSQKAIDTARRQLEDDLLLRCERSDVGASCTYWLIPKPRKANRPHKTAKIPPPPKALAPLTPCSSAWEAGLLITDADIDALGAPKGRKAPVIVPRSAN